MCGLGTENHMAYLQFEGRPDVPVLQLNFTRRRSLPCDVEKRSRSD